MKLADCPECKNGKHDNCVEIALSEDDDFVPCACKTVGNHGIVSVNIFDVSPSAES